MAKTIDIASLLKKTSHHYQKLTIAEVYTALIALQNLHCNNCVVDNNVLHIYSTSVAQTKAYMSVRTHVPRRAVANFYHQAFEQNGFMVRALVSQL